MAQKHSRILESLEKILGKNFVTDRFQECYYYSSDPSTEKSEIPEFIAMPKTVKEIQEILTLASQEKIPVTPRIGALTLSGLAIPENRGILLDLKRMNKILEINKESMYAVIECGVIIGQLKTYLEEKYPYLWFSMPHAPPSVGIIPNALIYGAGQLSLNFGANSDMLNGLEIVLPTGSILKTGSCALGRSWLTKYCLPDFMGLFLGWFGATGIITKASIQLWPKPHIRDALFYRIYNVNNLATFLSKLTKSEICDDICLYSWTGTSGRKRFCLSRKPENVPEITADVIVSGSTQEIINLKLKVIHQIIGGLSENNFQIEEYERPLQIKSSVLMVPRPFPFMDLMLGGGTEYLGCYIPTEKIETAYKKGVEIAQNYKFQYLHFIRPLRTGHLTSIMFIFPFDKRDTNQISRLLKVLEELSEIAINLGGVPWKPSPTIQKLILKRADPEYINFLRKMRKLLDPMGIMAPKQWAL